MSTRRTTTTRYPPAYAGMNGMNGMNMNRYGPNMNGMNGMNGMYWDRYRGMNSPMPRMSMDFESRFMDSDDRIVDPGCYGRSMFNYGWMMDGDLYNRYYRYMDFPERNMDMSGYQMDMYGFWMDMQGSRRNPFMSRFYN